MLYFVGTREDNRNIAKRTKSQTSGAWFWKVGLESHSQSNANSETIQLWIPLEPGRTEKGMKVRSEKGNNNKKSVLTCILLPHQIQYLGLQAAYHERRPNQMFSRKVMFLPYVPSDDVEDMFNRLVQQADQNAALQNLFEYVRKTWEYRHQQLHWGLAQ